MLELSTKQQLATAAKTLAASYELVQHASHLFLPMDAETRAPGPCAPERCVWTPLSRDDKLLLGNQQGILFDSDGSLTSFDLMLRQFARKHEGPVSELLLKTEHGLRALDEAGVLQVPDGSFHPNYIEPRLNESPDDKVEVLATLAGWLNSEEEAVSLLRHLSTALSPGWSAVKYLLLIGDGRNGKSVLLNMLIGLFGNNNVSHVTRQQIADRLPVCTELNAKLLNIVMDGEMGYIKDSAMEKTLIAGEPGVVRRLYENGNTTVQTRALFLEALNSEPKTRDKSGALQKRISRFQFPNVYRIDHAFERRMRSPRMLGALLALMIDHFVREDELAVKLQQSAASAALQLEQQVLNSPVLQFVQHLVQGDPSWGPKLLAGGVPLEPLIASFMAWRLDEGHTEYSTVDVKRMFKAHFHVDRKSVRKDGKVQKHDIIIDCKDDTRALLEQEKGVQDETGLELETLVAD